MQLLFLIYLQFWGIYLNNAFNIVRNAEFQIDFFAINSYFENLFAC